MVEFGDELIIESYRIPWLLVIWIQLLVMILLIVILFFGFTVSTTDPSASPSAAASPTTDHNAATPDHLDNPTSLDRIIKVEDQRATMDAGTSGASIREDDHPSEEESSLKDSMFFTIFQHPNHPCNYIGLAKRALFKCFGLDSSCESSSNSRHEKQE